MKLRKPRPWLSNVPGIRLRARGAMINKKQRASIPRGERVNVFTKSRAETTDDPNYAGASRSWVELATNRRAASEWTAMGDELRSRGELGAALRCYERALAVGGDPALKHMRAAEAALLLGDFERAWPHYEFRHHDPRSQDCLVPEYPFPLWNGEPLRDKTVLLRREYDCSDEIMFASVVPEIVHEARHVVLACHPGLERLFTHSFPAATVVSEKSDTRRLLSVVTEPGAVDFQAFLGSVPRFRRRSLEQFPRRARYLHPDPQQALYWRERIDALESNCVVGVRWHQGVQPSDRDWLSTNLEFWVPILAQSGVVFVSLQDGSAAVDAARVSAQTGIAIHDWRDAVSDIDTTAALLHELDLIISVCSPVANLAGALGKSTWILAPRVPEWRYGISGETMPWYSHARVFRQNSYGGWGMVIDQLAEELARFVEMRGVG